MKPKTEVQILRLLVEAYNKKTAKIIEEYISDEFYLNMAYLPYSTIVSKKDFLNYLDDIFKKKVSAKLVVQYNHHIILLKIDDFEYELYFKIANNVIYRCQSYKVLSAAEFFKDV